MEAPISQNSMLLLLLAGVAILHVTACTPLSAAIPCVGANEASCGGRTTGQLDDDMLLRRDLRRGKKQYEHEHRYLMSNGGIRILYRLNDNIYYAVISDFVFHTAICIHQFKWSLSTKYG